MKQKLLWQINGSISLTGKSFIRRNCKMNLQISPTTIALSFALVLVGVFISYKEQLGTAKEILYSITRAVIQLVAVGYILTYLFGIDSPLVTIGLVFVMSFNAAWNAHKRSNQIPNSLKISIIAIFSTVILTLTVLVLSGSIKF